MTTPSIAFNPGLTTVAAGSFGIDWDGLIQGTAFPDPATRFALAGGLLASTETLVMYGGVGIFEQVPPAVTTPSPGTPIALGGNVGRATALTGSKALTGFSAFDQDYAMINTPQSPVPTIGSFGQVNFYRLGSNARIAVACATGLVSDEGGLITQQVSWDFVAQELVPYTPAYASASISNAVWASTAGGQTTYTVGSDLSADLSAGSVIDVSGVVNTGGASAGAFNGNWVVVSVSSTTIVVTAPASASLGTYSSGGTVAGAGGALPCKILRIKTTNCMTVLGPDVNGNYTWNRNGSAAVIQI